MSVTEAGNDPLNFVLTTAMDSGAIASSSGDATPAPPQIHVHHFHHKSCQHHPEVHCTPFLSGGPASSRCDDDYAVVLNSKNTTRSFLGSKTQPNNNKNSNIMFSAPRKNFCTATIRHPSLASLVLHQPRHTHSPESVAASRSYLFGVGHGSIIPI